VIGAGKGSDCAPLGSNFESFFDAAPAARLEVVFPNAGHFQFVNEKTDIERSLCNEGTMPDSVVQSVTATALAVWADATLHYDVGPMFTDEKIRQMQDILQDVAGDIPDTKESVPLKVLAQLAVVDGHGLDYRGGLVYQDKDGG